MASNLILSTKNGLRIGTNYPPLSNGLPDRTVPVIDDQRRSRLQNAFGDTTPLWYYILKEAEMIADGKHLGPVGGRIVAEVFVALLQADKNAFMNAAPEWRPIAGKFGCLKNDMFTVGDLVTYAQS